jgi:hypothetical protein
VASGVVPIDSQGRLGVRVDLEQDEPPGLYYVVVVQDTDATHGFEAGPVACYQVR